MNVQPFSPNFLKTKNISVSGTSASATLDATDVLTGVNTNTQGNSVMRLLNAGPSTIFVRWGVGPQTALTSDMPLLAGSVEVFTKSPATDTIAAITASSTATLYITCGEGQ